MKISPDRKVDSTWRPHDSVNVYKNLLYKLNPLRKAKEKNVAIRVGVNSGSLDKETLLAPRFNKDKALYLFVT